MSTGVGEYASIALGSSGKVHISYRDYDLLSNTSALNYTTNASGSWGTETVDSGGVGGGTTAIALDISGNVHIIYNDSTNGDLKYATNQGTVTDIKANGSDGPVTSTGSLLVTVALDPASHSGDNADWWVAAETPYGWFYLVAGTMSWELAGTSYTDLLVTHQGALFNLSTVEVLDIPVAGLLPGIYTLYFAVDMDMNSSLDFDQFYYDSVVVNINP